MTETSRTGRRALLAALVFAVAYAVLRLYWAVGGRWAYTACDRTEDYGAAEYSGGCGADGLGALPFWSAWGAVVLAVLLATVAASAVGRPGKLAEIGLWIGAGGLVVLSFPAHLLFQLPVAIADGAGDWRDFAHHGVQLAGALILGRAAMSLSKSRRCGHPTAGGARRPARWARWAAYIGCAAPVLGFTAPHLLWLAGIPFGTTKATVESIRETFTGGTALAICLAPAVGGLLTLGLGMRWGRILFGRRVPRMLALAPATVVAAAITAYGVIGIGMMARDLSKGAAAWSDMAREWSLVGTEFVFLAWGLALGAAAWGYHLATRPRCEICEGAGGDTSPPAPVVTSPA